MTNTFDRVYDALCYEANTNSLDDKLLILGLLKWLSSDELEEFANQYEI